MRRRNDVDGTDESIELITDQLHEGSTEGCRSVLAIDASHVYSPVARLVAASVD